MFDKFTDKARKVMSLAQEEARGLDQLYVGTEHLLLALIKEGEGIAAQALAKLDVTYDETLATVKELTTGSGDPVPGGHIPFTPRTKRVLEDAYRETMTHGQTYIGTEHLLLGIVSEGNGRAMDALRTMGVSGDAVRNAVEELIESGTPGGSGPAEMTMPFVVGLVNITVQGRRPERSYIGALLVIIAFAASTTFFLYRPEWYHLFPYHTFLEKGLS